MQGSLMGTYVCVTYIRTYVHTDIHVMHTVQSQPFAAKYNINTHTQHTYTTHTHNTHTQHTHTTHIRYLSKETLQNPTKSAEIPRGFRAESAKLLCSYPRNRSTTSADGVSHFRGMIFRYPRNDTSLSAE